MLQISNLEFYKNKISEFLDNELVFAISKRSACSFI